MLKLFDFTCTECGHTWEDLVDGDSSPCPKCSKETKKNSINSGKLATFSLRDAASKRSELMRRSAEHSFKELKREPERFGAIGKERSRDGQIRSFGGFGRK